MLGKAPHPCPDEHLGSYLRRLVTLNGLITIGQLQTLMGTGKVFTPRSDNGVWKRFAEVTGLPDTVLAPMRWDLHGEGDDRWVVMSGARVRATYLNWSFLRICPACLAEHGYSRQSWSLQPVTACAEHGVRLSDCCPCGNPISTGATNFVWNCPKCGTHLADAPRTPASIEETNMAAAFAPTPAQAAYGFSPLPQAFMSLDLSDRISVVERLGNIHRLALVSEAAPPIRPDRIAKVDQISKRRRLDDARPITIGAHRLLKRWPEAYIELLFLISDRHGPPMPGDRLISRFGTPAGVLAMSKLLGLDGTPIGFVDQPTSNFMVQIGGSTTRRNRTLGAQATLARHAPKASGMSSIAADEAISTGQAVALLQGTAAKVNSQRIRPWVKTGLLPVHKLADDILVVRRADVANVVRRIEALRAENDHDDWLEIAETLRLVRPPYRPEDLVLDLLCGDVTATRMHPTRSGLASLGVSRSSLQRRRRVAIVAGWLMGDEYQPIKRLSDEIEAIWGKYLRLGVAQADAMVDKALWHRRIVMWAGPKYDMPQKHYRVRDVIEWVQQQESDQIFRISPEVTIKEAGWRNALATPTTPNQNDSFWPEFSM